MTQKLWSQAEYWDQRYLQSDFPWDMGVVSPTLVALVDQFVQKENHPKVLVPGCGFGHDAKYLAGLGCNVVAVDWSQAAVDKLNSHIQNNPQKNLTVVQGDFWKLPHEWESQFDVFVEHTFLCAFDPTDRSRYFEQVEMLLKPGGIFLGALFIHPPEREPTHLSINEAQGGPPFWTTKQELCK